MPVPCRMPSQATGNTARAVLVLQQHDDSKSNACCARCSPNLQTSWLSLSLSLSMYRLLEWLCLVEWIFLVLLYTRTGSRTLIYKHDPEGPAEQVPPV